MNTEDWVRTHNEAHKPASDVCRCGHKRADHDEIGQCEVEDARTTSGYCIKGCDWV